MELWDALDKNGNLTGQMLVRGEPVPDGLYHLVVSVLVRHTDGTFLLMRRDYNKEGWPGVFEATAGGSAVAGEESLTAAKRELAEETGITRGDFSPLYFDRGQHAIYHGYLCDTDWPKDQITLQEGETVEYRWVTADELRAMMDVRPFEVVVQVGARAWLDGAPAPVHLNSTRVQLATRTLEAGSVTAHKGARRPVWHLAPQANWMNDPNGCIFYQGKYHAFWQCNPYAPRWSSMHWAHAVSEDLIHWTYLPVALAPDQPYDDDIGGGCFSGSAIEKDGRLYLMYTGVKDRRQAQCLASSADGITFEKEALNPLIPGPPEGHSPGFRDPKVLKHNGCYYVLVGSSKDGDGCAVLYRSGDLLNWSYVGVAAKSNGQYGDMWECPDLFQLDGKWVMTVCPMHMERCITRYFVGEMDFDTGVFTKEAEGTLDMGWEYYAPQTFQHTGDTRIQIAWQGHWDWMPFACPPSTEEEGWRWSMAIPRILWLDDTLHIRCRPVDAIHNLPDENGAYVRRFRFDQPVTLWPRGREGENLYVKVDPAQHLLEIARRLPGQQAWDAKRYSLSEDVPDVTIIADRNAVDMFADGGRLAFSCCDNDPGEGILITPGA
ncbi:MAG: NUDIX domain-containing protein [Clostridia bacterium]|nr:NUDIX domain-containing protein [Clostridia bacterium]